MWRLSQEMAVERIPACCLLLEEANEVDEGRQLAPLTVSMLESVREVTY